MNNFHQPNIHQTSFREHLKTSHFVPLDYFKTTKLFPEKLYEILTTEKFETIITFSGDGNSWRVINKKLLETVVLPKYFRSKKYLSFTRNVLGWGFKRVGKAEYSHEVRSVCYIIFNG